jgi:NAD(P)-dependent dehydrogenase (short-subunit alcohol dehydrogenase family)
MTRRKPEVAAGVGGIDLSGKTYVVTGSTRGIGRRTALALARLGAHVVVHGRDEAKGKEVVERAGRTRGSADLITADLSRLSSVRSLADEVRGAVGRIDALLNNAGGWFSEGSLTEDGVEYTFAVNHLAPFVLTAELLPLLAETEGRVVTTSSSAHRRGGHELTTDAVTTVDGYSGFSAYCRSKLANVLFTRELSRRLDVSGTPVTANCFHPGAVPGTGFARGTPLPFRLAARLVSALPEPLQSRLVTTPEEGAETAVMLASRPSLGVSGEYLKDLRPSNPSEEARDDEKARTLWGTSEALTGAEYDLV